MIGARDTEGAAQGDDPMLEVDIDARRVVVSDDPRDAAYSVTIAIDGEPEHR